MDKSLKKYYIFADTSVKDAMKQLDQSHRKTLFVVKDENMLIGTLTDGDIRRWILDGKSLTDQSDAVCNKNPFKTNINYNISDIKQLMLDKRIEVIPVVDEQNMITNLLFWDSVFDDDYKNIIYEKLSLPVVIMAGGAGTRLEPFTKILPKPLIPVGDKSILEVIINQFRDYGIDDYYISVFHKSKIIKAYLEDLNLPYKINYLNELKPLGTAGALSLIKQDITSSLILTNCDTIIKCNYNDMVKFHDKNNYDITLVGSMINYQIPYGICEIKDEGQLVNLVEKPEYSYLVSTGMYIIRNSALALVPNNQFYNMTDLIHKVKKENGNVGVYPISEKSWLDTGEWKEYKQTVEQLNL